MLRQMIPNFTKIEVSLPFFPASSLPESRRFCRLNAGSAKGTKGSGTITPGTRMPACPFRYFNSSPEVIESERCCGPKNGVSAEVRIHARQHNKITSTWNAT
jgi:hypothetical protein